MGLASIKSAAIIGLTAIPIDVEVDISNGLPTFKIVGLPDKAVEEARERVRSALKNSNMRMPDKRLTVNLAPADVKKVGPAYDLPIAVGLALASEQINISDGDKMLFVGELALNGDARGANGIIAIANMAKREGYTHIFVPSSNAKEASLIDGIKVIPTGSLRDLLLHLREEQIILPHPQQEIVPEIFKTENDMKNIAGQEQAKRALEIAAAGGHNIIMSGPPGSGKTMLAKALPGILPVMNVKEILDVTNIYSVAGMLKNQSIISSRPFRSPHHTSSYVALVGGGNWPAPGEVSLAHRGVLFLDELPEFPRNVLEVLRQPLEDGEVNIARSAGKVTFPARFMLVAAKNPCPCGYFGDDGKPCICSAGQIETYNKKISGPLLDRIDIHIEVPRVEYKKLRNPDVNLESSSLIRERIGYCRDIQKSRYENSETTSNSEMTSDEMKAYCVLDETCEQLLENAVNQYHLSPRSYTRILKLARTIADLESEQDIKPTHLAEAIRYKVTD